MALRSVICALLIGLSGDASACADELGFYDNSIDYDVLANDALRSVVRTVLLDTERNGLRGEHHYYITFKTLAPDVRLSRLQRDKHPDRITIALQYEFEDLEVGDNWFSVQVRFSGRPERIRVPFLAITDFYDPSVSYELHFEKSASKHQK